MPRHGAWVSSSPAARSNGRGSGHCGKEQLAEEMWDDDDLAVQETSLMRFRSISIRSITPEARITPKDLVSCRWNNECCWQNNSDHVCLAALHHCLAETEAFVFQLRSAVDVIVASKDKKARKKKNGSVVDEPPALPPELEMVNAFKRIKLAINYVASLKTYLYDPNGPELIHILFGYLGTLIEICRTFGSPYSAATVDRVVLPLLSRDSIQLLRHCLVSKEIDLWKTLGKAWTLPRDQWKGEGYLCNAVFLEGWEAYYPPNGIVVNPQPWRPRSRHRSSGYSSPSVYTESGTALSERSPSLVTSRSVISPI